MRQPGRRSRRRRVQRDWARRRRARLQRRHIRRLREVKHTVQAPVRRRHRLPPIPDPGEPCEITTMPAFLVIKHILPPQRRRTPRGMSASGACPLEKSNHMTATRSHAPALSTGNLHSADRAGDSVCQVTSPSKRTAVIEGLSPKRRTSLLQDPKDIACSQWESSTASKPVFPPRVLPLSTLDIRSKLLSVHAQRPSASKRLQITHKHSTM